MSCTTIIVNKGASADNSRMICRTEDSFCLDVKKLCFYKGDENRIGYIGVPSTAAQNRGRFDECTLNRKGVFISASETIYANERALKFDPLIENGISETDLPSLIIPYVKTARQGAEMLAALLEKYGSRESNGVAFADRNEIWYMEIYTGHRYIAVKVPENACAVIGNDALIGFADINDRQNVISSNDIVDFAKKHGFYKEFKGRVHFAATYGKEKRVYSQIRVWGGIHKLAPKFAGKFDVNKTYPIFFKPDKKISVFDVFELTRYRYEDTVYNANFNKNIRAIAVNRTAEAHLCHISENSGETLYLCLGNTETGVYLPIKNGTTNFPESFTLDTAHYNPDSAYFKFRRLSAVALLNREKWGKYVRDKWKNLEKEFVEQKQILPPDEMFLKNGEKALKVADKMFLYVFEEFLNKSLFD